MNATVTQLQTGLFTSLGATVLVLAIAVILAHKHKVNAHIAMICVFLVVFVTTVFFAEALGRHYDFNHISKPIHLSLAIFTTIFVLAPLTSGFLHWRNERVSRKAHQRIAWVWATFVVLSLVTGAWMLSNGTLKTSPSVPAQSD
jgi:ABC-type iron transport system FetAB permease component